MIGFIVAGLIIGGARSAVHAGQAEPEHAGDPAARPGRGRSSAAPSRGMLGTGGIFELNVLGFVLAVVAAVALVGTAERISSQRARSPASSTERSGSITGLVSENVVVAAEPAVHVWAAVSDPTQTRQWSPENTGADGRRDRSRWAETFDGSQPPVRVSAWTTRCTVTALRTGASTLRLPGGRHRPPHVPACGRTIASWEYQLEPADGGTRVTETWTDDRRWPDLGAAVFDRVVTRGSTFAEHNRANIGATLAGLQRELGPGC